MKNMIPRFDIILIGNDSLTQEVGRMALEAGHPLRAVVTRAALVRKWAEREGLTVLDMDRDALSTHVPEADWIISAANLDLLRPDVLARARRGAVNLHDGPLPRHAGLNGPVFAILEGDREYGITWHLISGGVDEGAILVRRDFDITEDETALSLNRKCFAAALESFPELIAALEQGNPGAAQDLARRTLHRRAERPAHAGRIDPAAPVADILRLRRALDHGNHPNPVGTVRVVIGDDWFSVTGAEPAPGEGAPGTVLSVTSDGFTLAAGDGALRLLDLRDGLGRPVAADSLLRAGDIIERPRGDEGATLAAVLKYEPHWRAVLAALEPAAVPQLGGLKGSGPLVRDFTFTDAADSALARFAAMIAEGDERPACDLALARGKAGLLSDRVPVRFAGEDSFPAALAAARSMLPYPGDLPLRLGTAVEPLAVAVSDDLASGLLPGTALTFAAQDGHARLSACPDQISPAAFNLLAARLAHRLAGGGGLAPEDRSLVEAANATNVAVTPETLDRLILAQAARNPDRTAILCETRALTFAQVEDAANRLANRLRAAGVKRGAPVGLFLRRSEMLPVAALAVWKAGAAYLPLDPAYPADRLAHYLNDSRAGIILTSQDLAAALPPHQASVLLIEDEGDDPTPPPASATPRDAAYVIYTSGSTGTPKGVVVEHRQVANFFTGMSERIPHGDRATWLAVTSLSFDISVLEFFWTLASGIRIVVMGDGDRTMVARNTIADTPEAGDFSLAAQILRHEVTHLQCTPSMARMLVTNEDSRRALARLEHILIGGEALPGALVAELKRATGASITNLYGPTETTIWSSTAPAVAEESTNPIGTPVANTQFHILDEQMQPVVPGVAGELWIGGAGVARGYLGRDDLTAAAFRTDPAHGRIYRTGDLARWRADGSVDFLGRIDGQIKLRGHRIETGEIEAALTACDGVQQAVVVLRDDALVAYVTGTGNEAELRPHLARRLPAYMLPARIVTLDALPLTPNGKIDRKALPAPVAPARHVPRAPAATGNVATRVAGVWAQLLGTGEISPRDNFFDIGGHSILAVQAHRDLRAATGAQALSITDIYRFPTLGGLTGRIESLLAPAPAPGAAPAGADTARTEAMARRRALRARRSG